MEGNAAFEKTEANPTRLAIDLHAHHREQEPDHSENTDNGELPSRGQCSKHRDHQNRTQENLPGYARMLLPRLHR